MQERYLGDVHDYIKFCYLKFTSNNIKQKIGLNWYLNNPEKINEHITNPNDGEKRNFKSQRKIKLTDNKLLYEIEELKKTENRILLSFTRKTHLKKFINFYNIELDKPRREKWFQESLIFFKKNNYIFLDPDNGLQPQKVKSTQKKSVKYVLIDEIRKLIENNKSVTFCQFQSYSQKFLTMLKEKNDFLREKTGLKFNCPIIRNRTSPNTFFITIATSCYKKKLTKNINDFKKNFENVELITI